MRTFISSVALSLALLSQSAFYAVANPNGSSKTQSITAVTCTPRTIGRDGIQLNWQGNSEWPVALTAYDFNGISQPFIFQANAPSHIQNSGGVGLISSQASGEYSDNRRFEFARRFGKSEKLRVDFGDQAMSYGGGLKKATVTVSRFYLDGGKIRERGRWVALDESFNVVAPIAPGSDLFYGVQNSGSGPGILTFTAETNLPFRYLELIPLEGVDKNNFNQPVNSTVDNSDFIVRQIVIEFCEPQTPGPCGSTLGQNGLLDWNNAILAGTGYDGEPVTPGFVANPVLGGWGIVSSNPADNGPFKPEVGFRFFGNQGRSEKLSVTVAGASSEYIGAKVKLSRFYKELGFIEKGLYQLLDVNGLPIPQSEGGQGAFFAVEPNVSGNPGHFEFEIWSDRPFTTIIFTADAWVNGGGNPGPNTNRDNSDYHVQKISLLCEREPAFCNECDARIGDEGLEGNWTGVVGLSATDFNGAASAVTFTTDATWRAGSAGFGVQSVGAPEVAAPQGLELGFRANKTETATVDFGECNEFTLAEVTLSRFYIENGLIERGKWTAYGPGMVMLTSGEFQATEPIGNNGPGYLTFAVETATKFQYIKFEVLANKRASNDEIVTGGSDNSDYLIRSINIRCPQQVPCNEVIGRGGDESLWSEYVDISAYTFGTTMTPGSPIAPYFLADGVNWRPNSGGIGVLSPGAPETAATAKFELGYRDFKSEKMVLDFRRNRSFNKIIVKLSRFYIESNKREQGFWRALDRDGNEIDRGNFLATEQIGANGPGYFDLTIETATPMSVIEFTAGPNVNVGNGLPNESTADNSDYFIREFSLPCPPNGNGAGVGFKATEEVSNTIAANDFTIYPNPAVDQINISMDSKKEGAVSYVVRDLTGKVLRSATWNIEAGSNKTSIPVGNLNNGMYLITITQGDVVKNTKFMIKR